MVIDYIWQFIRGNMALRIVAIVNVVVITPMLIRTLGVEDYGYYGYLFGLVSLLYLFLSLGTMEYGNLYVPTQTNDKNRSILFYTLLMTRLLLAPIYCVILYFILKNGLFDLNVEERYIPFVLLWTFAFTITCVIEVINRLLKINIYYSFQLALNVLLILAMVYTILSAGDSYMLFSLSSVVYIILALVALYIFLKNIAPRPMDLSIMQGHWRECGFLFLTAITWAILTFTDKYFIMQYLGKGYELGAYNVASVIAYGLLMFVFIPVKGFMLNFVSLAIRKEDTDLEQKSMGAFMVIFPIFIMPFVLGLAVYGEPFVVFYGSADAKIAHSYTFWVTSAIFAYTFAQFFLEKMLMHDPNKNKYALFVNLFLLTINIALNMTLVPLYGALGAAYTLFITLVGGAGIIIYLSQRSKGRLHHMKSYLSPWVVLIVVYGIGHQFWDDNYGLWATMLFSGFSWVFVILGGWCFKEPRELYLWLWDRIQLKYNG